MITLSDFQKNVGGMESLRSEIFKTLGENVFDYPDWISLVHAALKVIKEVAEPAKENTSIESGAKEVLKYLKMDEKDDDYSLYLNHPQSIKELEALPAARVFANFILALDKLPRNTYLWLDSKVKEHLSELTTLMGWYESQGTIRSILKENRKPDNHEEAVLFDFYSRCISEQKNIIKYFLTGVKPRALAKAMAIHLGLGSVFAKSERFRDFPYKFGHYGYEPYFDCRLLDQVGHRLADVIVSRGRALEKQYKEDKAEFYKEYFTIKPVAQIFQSMRFWLSHLPTVNDRTNIFVELKSLFDSNQWLPLLCACATTG